MILHKVYVDCSSGCKGSNYNSYKTPFGCYIPNTFDDYENYDVYDEILTWDRSGHPTLFRRTYFYSTDGSCQDQIYDGLFGTSWEYSLPSCSGYSSEDYSLSTSESLIYEEQLTHISTSISNITNERLIQEMS